jgi:hypothetical protein
VISAAARKNEPGRPACPGAGGNGGRPGPALARGRDLPGQHDGHKIPHGTCDAGASTGYVNAVTDHSTAAFPAEPARATAHHGRAARHKLDLIRNAYYCGKLSQRRKLTQNMSPV